ncbi:VOC family protein [Aliikangiella coralliicola]|uniref:VOC family protein n=1 Tax=Aliikangiella coralliicola TaxID=2592383 RepID=A0A545UK54_9GAMM|nr:hypothetical protein [Aliikangiella coralliicola]TQV89847.1 hypothetical protein FLL46_02950 [Aliikangiella coralliicola]
MNKTTSWKAVAVMPTLGVTDLEVMTHYYLSLGFEERWRYPDIEPVTHIGMTFGEVTLMFYLCSNSEVEKQNIYFIMQDIAGYHQHVKDIVPKVEPLCDADYGMRDFSIADPWGHQLNFGEAY